MFPAPTDPTSAELRHFIRGAGSLLVLFAVLLGAGRGHAQTVVPTGYTIDSLTPPQGQVDGGSYNYFDDVVGGQLIDGIRGIDDWTANLGNGNAYEWVAWITFDPKLTFNFSTTVSIQSVTLGMARAELNGGIYIPASVKIGTETFTLTGSEFADTTRQDRTFMLATPFVGSALTIELTRHSSGWVFLDEVQFTAVPEPAAVWVIALVGGTALSWRLRRRAASDHLG